MNREDDNKKQSMQANKDKHNNLNNKKAKKLPNHTSFKGRSPLYEKKIEMSSDSTYFNFKYILEYFVENKKEKELEDLIDLSLRNEILSGYLVTYLASAEEEKVWKIIKESNSLTKEIRSIINLPKYIVLERGDELIKIMEKLRDFNANEHLHKKESRLINRKKSFLLKIAKRFIKKNIELLDRKSLISLVEHYALSNNSANLNFASFVAVEISKNTYPLTPQNADELLRLFSLCRETPGIIWYDLKTQIKRVSAYATEETRDEFERMWKFSDEDRDREMAKLIKFYYIESNNEGVEKYSGSYDEALEILSNATGIREHSLWKEAVIYILENIEKDNFSKESIEKFLYKWNSEGKDRDRELVKVARMAHYLAKGKMGETENYNTAMEELILCRGIEDLFLRKKLERLAEELLLDEFKRIFIEDFGEKLKELKEEWEIRGIKRDREFIRSILNKIDEIEK